MMADRTFAIGHLHRLSTIRLARAERMPHEANGRVPFCSVLLHSPVAAVASQLPFPAIAKDRRNLPIASGGSLHAGGNSPFPSRFPGQCPATPFRCLSRTGHPSNATCEKICCDVGPARCHGPHPRHAAGGHRAARPVAWTGRRRWHGRWWRTQSIDSRTDWICRYARRTGPRQLDAGTRRQKVSGDNCRLVQSSYADLPDVLRDLAIDTVDRVLVDLGAFLRPAGRSESRIRLRRRRAARSPFRPQSGATGG